MKINADIDKSIITQSYINDICYKIVGCAIEVHKNLGPGLMESVYQACLIEELKNCGLTVKSQTRIPLNYKGKDLNLYHVLDLLVNDLVIVELKAVETVIPLFKAQLLSYLRLTNLPKGLLINFNCENITKSLVPIVTEEFSNLPKN